MAEMLGVTSCGAFVRNTLSHLGLGLVVAQVEAEQEGLRVPVFPVTFAEQGKRDRAVDCKVCTPANHHDVGHLRANRAGRDEPDNSAEVEAPCARIVDVVDQQGRPYRARTHRRANVDELDEFTLPLRSEGCYMEIATERRDRE